jgi:serine/threonine protein kinase
VTEATAVTERVADRFVAGALIAERYRLRRIVGAGGMATVWRGEDEVLARPVAVKVMSDALAADPAYVARFDREARTAASISHPNLVQVYDYGTCGTRPYLVMEFIDGGTLAQRIERGPLSAAEQRALAEELLAAVACVHRAGVLHRDIKPANVLLGSDGRARLTDFGIARIEDTTQLTLPGQVVGTLRFLAPELIDGGAPTRRSDLYALGVLLREIPLLAPPDPRVRELIDRLAAPRPEDRPTDAEQARGLLELEGPAGVVVHRTRRVPGRAVAVLVTVIALVLFAALSSGGGSSGSRPPARPSGPARTNPTLEQRLDALAAGVRAAARP